MWLVRAASLLAVAGWWSVQAVSTFPCPDIVRYVSVDAQQGRWDGIISLPAENITYPLWVNVTLDSKADFLLEDWAADVTSFNNKEFIVNGTNTRTQPTQLEDIRFYVKYNFKLSVPKVIAIRLNGVAICNAELSQSAPGRQIVDSNVMTTAEGTIRKKRQISWAEYISTRNKKPVRSQPRRPGHTSQSSHSSWMCYISGYQASPSCGQLDSRVGTTPEHEDQGGENSAMPAPKPQPFDDKETCGQVSARPALYKGNSTRAGQWPWQIALYHYEHVHNKFKCGGTLISRQHVVTAAHCVTLKGSSELVKIDTISIYLGRHNLRNSTRGVQIRFVSDVVVHPEYNPTLFARDLSILKLMESVQYTDYVRPICLWPEDKVELSNIVGKIGTVVGWGLDQNGVETDELGQIEIPVVSQFTCLKSNSKFYETYTSNTTYCAGLGGGSTACQGDSGGGMVINMDGTWYLRGLVSVSLEHVINGCDPSNYVVFTDLAKFLPWIKETIGSI